MSISKQWCRCDSVFRPIQVQKYIHAREYHPALLENGTPMSWLTIVEKKIDWDISSKVDISFAVFFYFLLFIFHSHIGFGWPWSKRMFSDMHTRVLAWAERCLGMSPLPDCIHKYISTQCLLAHECVIYIQYIPIYSEEINKALDLAKQGSKMIHTIALA